MQRTGKIIKWDDTKGFGFVTSMDGSKEIFIHISAFKKHNRNNNSYLNKRIVYTLSKDKEGRVCATDASIRNSFSTTGSMNNETIEKPNISIKTLFILIIFYAGLLYIFELNTIVIPLILVYVIIGLITYLLYAKDKSAAINDTWRISENTLHLFSLLGGWTGALIAQDRLKHKSKKRSFQIVFLFTILINIFLVKHFFLSKMLPF